MSKDIHALLNHLGHYTLFLAGNDFGGTIAYALATAYPKSVHRLAVFESLVLLPTAKAALASWFVTFFQMPGIPEVLPKGHKRYS